MNRDNYGTYQINHNPLIVYTPIAKKANFDELFENTCIFISLLGPLFLLTYFVLSHHIYIYFNIVKDTDAIAIFNILYASDLIFLSKILFTGSLFSGIGVILAGVHENMVLFFFCLICFFLSIGFYIPTLIMYTAD